MLVVGRNISRKSIAIRSFSLSIPKGSAVRGDEQDVKGETPKRKYTKKTKPIDLTGALKSTYKLVPHEKEIETFGEDTPDAKVPTNKPKKIDRSYAKELDKNVLSKNVRRAINISNHERKKVEDEETGAETEASRPPSLARDNIYARRKRIQLAGLNTDERSKLFKNRFKPSNWIPRKTNSYEPNEASSTVKPKKIRPLPYKETVPIKHRQSLEVSDAEPALQNTTGASKLEQAEKLNQEKIPKLAHNLDRALFSPGVNFLQDPRTRVYNFPPFLKKIVSYSDFDFGSISTFQSVSKDETLLSMAKKHQKSYYSSTSSMTSTFMQFYMLLNNYNAVKTSRFNFEPFSGFVSSLPTTLIVQVKGKDNDQPVYSVESDKSHDNEILLSAMGHCLETLLTTEEKEFEAYKKSSDEKPPKPLMNVYNYSKIGKFLLRSQLDCYDERLPGNGTFDLKTRAACSVRYDSTNPDPEQNNYQIWRLNGEYESFAKEFKDLVRTGALLKYAFQARIGQMDGIYVAYHNINSFFGFQYFPLQELDEIFYNHEGVEKYKHKSPENLHELSSSEINIDELNDKLPTYVAETQFAMTIDIYQDLLDTITKDLPTNSAFRLIMKSEHIKRGTSTRLYAYAVPISPKQIKELQSFPDSFQTSFKENISPEQRTTNLQAHRDRLTKFNQDVVKDKVIYGYYIDINEHMIDGKVNTNRCAYPQRVGAPWTVKYTIHRLNHKDEQVNNRSRAHYLDLLSVPTNAIAMASEKRPGTSGDGSREDLIRIYSTIGQARASRWEKLDQQPVMYEPSK